MKSMLTNTRKPDIIFHSSGRIDITSSISSHLRLSVGDVIDILTDGEEFYLYVKHRAPIAGRHEGKIRFTNNRGRHCRTASIRLCKAILKECNSDKIARLSVGKMITDSQYGDMLPIITKHLL